MISIRSEITIVSSANVVHLTEGRILVTVSPNGTWRGDASLTGSETVAWYQMPLSESLSIANIFKINESCKVPKLFRRTMSSGDEVKLTDFHIKESIAYRINYFKENVFISMINYYQVIVNDGDTNRHRR